MASLTIRKLDDAIKAALRLRAAQHGRSVEDEVRVILRAAAQNQAPDAAPASPSISRTAALENHVSGKDSDAFLRATLIIGGGIAAYKALDLIRRLKDHGFSVRCVLTHAAQQFVTPLAASALSNQRSYTDLFDPASEFDAGHIRLARDCDLVVVAPATADLMAKMAHGHANDLATAILLATDRPILLAPAMNPLMWNNAATRRNVAQLLQDGVRMIGPNAGGMAEAGEVGVGRMAEPVEIANAAAALVQPPQPGPLAGKRILITAGPTHEPIDPVRYIANRSSGKQGFAIAAAAHAAGADVTLISGPVELDDPTGVTMKHVESAREMLEQVEAALPADVAIFAAAVADWRVAHAGEQKIKKTSGGMPQLELIENPDILATISKRTEQRPALVIGFAAETEHLLDNAQAKLARKGCDWIVANDVSPATGIMGGDRNTVHLISKVDSNKVSDTARSDSVLDDGIRIDGVHIDAWPAMSKDDVAAKLIARIAVALKEPS